MKNFIYPTFKAALKLNDDGGLAIASNVALSLLLSLFPFLMLVAALVRFYGEPELASQVVDLVLGHWPADSAKPIADQIGVLLDQPPSEFFSISTLIALVLASNGIENARDGLNRAYKVVETRSFFWRRVQGALFVLVGALGLILAAVILIATPFVWSFFVERVPLIGDFAFTVTLAQYGLACSILGLVLLAFHLFLPNVSKPRPKIIVGIVVTIFGILIGSKLFGLYLQTIANFRDEALRLTEEVDYDG